MENWINFDNLPRNTQGNISWNDCDHNLVNFNYRGNNGCLFVQHKIDANTVMIQFHNEEMPINIESLKRVCLGKLFNFAVKDNYHYHAGDVIVRSNSKLKIVECIRIYYENQKSVKGYRVFCMACNNTFEISEANLDRGDGCNVCSNHKVAVGINDLWTTRPDVAKMLQNAEDGHKYMQYSNVMLDFVCPKCSRYIGKSYLHNVARFGLSCPFCGSGISFPNRLMNSILSSLNLNYDGEVVFDWCMFPSYQDASSLSYGRYDFVIWDLMLIIEMDGGFGHGNEPHPFSHYSKDELIYRDMMKNSLADQNGYVVIRIDCDYKTNDKFGYCVNSIINSQLSSYLKLEIIDWENIKKLTL